MPLEAIRDSLKTGYFHFLTFDGEGMKYPFLATVPTATNVGPSKDLIDRALVVNSSCLLEVNQGEFHVFFNSVPHLIISFGSTLISCFFNSVPHLILSFGSTLTFQIGITN